MNLQVDFRVSDMGFGAQGVDLGFGLLDLRIQALKSITALGGDSG